MFALCDVEARIYVHRSWGRHRRWTRDQSEAKHFATEEEAQLWAMKFLSRSERVRVVPAVREIRAK